MRKRITYVHGPEDAFDPSQLQLKGDTLHIQSLKSVKEERLSFGFDELPQDLWQVLKQCHELHIRWASEYPYTAISPFVSRVSPGLHAFFTPSRNRSIDLLCPLLRKIFSEDLKCESPKETFTAPPILSERFASSASLQYHQLLPSLKDLVTYIQQKICRQSDHACFQHASSLLSASYLDIDYDSISHALVLNGYWTQSPDPDGWTEQIQTGGTDKVEVGVLASEQATEPEELSLGGFLTVVGEDSKPNPTLFSFPSRHHPLPSSTPQTYTISFPPPTGLHPTLRIHFPQGASTLTPPSTIPSTSTCALHTYLTLPSALFADKYQLSTTDPLFLQSHNLRSLRSIAGETDLEAPDWTVSKWGSNVLLELATPAHSRSQSQGDDGDDGGWTATVHLHLRYLPPSSSGLRALEIPWPIVFWACTAEEGSKMGMNPFDRSNLGWEGLFGTRSMFYQLLPAVNGSAANRERLVERLEVPVLRIDVDGEGKTMMEGWMIEWGTVLVVLVGFAWVMWKLGVVAWESGFEEGEGGGGKESGRRKGTGKKDQ